MSITIIEETDDLNLNNNKIRRRLGLVIKDLGYHGYNLTILMTNDEGIRNINREYRNKDKSTNVLAFPDTDLALGQPNYLGDLVISLQTLKREAQEQGQDLGYLLYFYLIHGLLHLIGFDHEKGHK
jgi:probable rRNA maturation factor